MPLNDQFLQGNTSSLFEIPVQGLIIAIVGSRNCFTIQNSILTVKERNGAAAQISESTICNIDSIYTPLFIAFSAFSPLFLLFNVFFKRFCGVFFRGFCFFEVFVFLRGTFGKVPLKLPSKPLAALGQGGISTFTCRGDSRIARSSAWVPPPQALSRASYHTVVSFIALAPLRCPSRAIALGCLATVFL